MNARKFSTFFAALFLACAQAASAQTIGFEPIGAAHPEVRIVQSRSSVSAARNDIHSVQRAADYLGRKGGGYLVLPSRDYYFGPAAGAFPATPGECSLLLDDNTHVVLGENTTIHRRCLTGADVDATIRNRDFDNGNTNISVRGGTIEATSAAFPGKHLVFNKVAGLTVDGVKFAGVQGTWNTAFFNCSDVLVTRVYINSGDGLHEAGLQFGGCERVNVSNSIIICGDDAIAFVNETYPIPPVLGPMSDVTVTNCYLWSKCANAFKVLVAGPPEGAFQTLQPIRRVQVSNVVCKTGPAATSGGIVIYDGNALGLVSDVHFQGVTLDASTNGEMPLQVYGAHDCSLTGVRIRQPLTRCQIDACHRLSLVDCVVDTPRHASTQCLLVANLAACSDIHVRGGRYVGATHHAIVLGSAGQAVTRFSIQGVERIASAGATTRGVLLTNAVKGRIQDNYFAGNAGFWLEEAAPSTNNVARGNTLDGNGNANAASLNGAGNSVASDNFSTN